MRLARALTTFAAGALAAITAYLLAHLAAAGVSRLRRPPAAAAAPAGPGWRWIVLVPAHDEEPVIAGTLAEIARMDADGEREVVVVADHCSDRTAELAAAAGATVLEREGGDRGKAPALRWALAELRPRLAEADGVVLIDADCHPTPGLLRAVERRMREGARVVQTSNEVDNPEAGPSAALRDAAFRLMNAVRPMGKDALGLSAGLRGTGMAFRSEVLLEHGWGTESLAEDHEQHLVLVAAGERVAFVADEAVRSDMPATIDASREQLSRYESGRWPLFRTWAPRLTRDAIRLRDPVRADAVLNMFVPPQTLLLAAVAGVTAAAAVLRAPAALRLAVSALAAQVVYVLGGLVVTGAPRATWRGLAYAPLLVAQKLGIVADLARGRGPQTFVRTERDV